MNRIDLNTAVREIVQSSSSTGDDTAPPRGQQPFFFIVGAGVSYPSIPLAHIITEECKTKASDAGCDGVEPKEAIDRYTHWLKGAYPSARDRQSYFHGLIHKKDISHATLRLVQLLESHRVGEIVVTPNFDDLLSRGLTLFGEDFLAIDHPAVVQRIDPNRGDLIQLVHVHGTHWNYDIENLRVDLQHVAQDNGPHGMLGCLRNLLHSKSPIVIGYTGWENDVIMTALKEHCQTSTWPYNLYWFCYNEDNVRALPAWLTGHACVSVVAPPEPKKENPAESSKIQDGPFSVASKATVEPLSEAAPTLPAVLVLEKLIERLNLDAPRITTDPLGVYRNRIAGSIPAADGTEPDEFGFGEVLGKINRAIECAEMPTGQDEAGVQRPLLAKILEASRRSQPEELIDAVEELYTAGGFAALENPLRRTVAWELLTELPGTAEEDPRYDQILDLLRALSVAHPEDAAVRENLTMGLNNAIFHSEVDFRRADGLLGELRRLAEDHPEDDTVRKLLAKGLFDAFNNSDSGSPRADGLLRELWELTKTHPEDKAVRELLTKGLYNAHHDSDSGSPRANELLGKLRGLAKTHPEDDAVRELFTRGLFNVFQDSASGSPRADGLLWELRGLTKAHPKDDAVREWLAKGLFNAFHDSALGSPRADGLLRELRELAEDHPENDVVRENLASGLYNAHLENDSDSPRANGLLRELRELTQAHPEDTAVRQRLAMALKNTITDNRSDFRRADGLLGELRTLAGVDPKGTLTPALSQREREENVTVRKLLAMAYGVSIRHATAAGDVGRAAEMAEALVPLREAVLSQPGMMPVFKQAFEAAVGLAVERGDVDAERRLRAAREAIFGE